MGTLVEITVYEKDEGKARQAITQAFNEMRRIEKGYWKIEREQVIGPEMKALLEKGIKISRLTGGAFDFTVLPLVRLWKIGSGKEEVPDSEEIKRTIGLVDYRKVELEGDRVSFFRRGMGIDLSGMAKGLSLIHI